MAENSDPDDYDPDLGAEPTATSDPPPGVEIPVDSFYGSNTPVTPPPLSVEAPGATAAPSAAASGNSIRIPIAGFFVVLLGLLGASFFVGNQLAPTTTIIQQQGGIGPSRSGLEITDQSAPKEQKPRSNIVLDFGLFKGKNEEDSWTMLENRIQIAQNQIFVITSNPSHHKLLKILSARKKIDGISIFVITNTDTPIEQTDPSKRVGIPTYRMSGTLERPFCMILLDNKLVIDASRDHWYWESTEPTIIKTFQDWVTQIGKTTRPD